MEQDRAFELAPYSLWLSVEQKYESGNQPKQIVFPVDGALEIENLKICYGIVKRLVPRVIHMHISGILG